MDQDRDIACRFAVLGDAEPKPHPEFPNLAAAIDAINRLHSSQPFDFVAGIGDLPHRGTPAQYEALDELLPALTPRLHAIVGNEEMDGTIMDFFRHASTWNENPNEIPSLQFERTYGGYRFVFAGAGADGKGFTTAERTWLLDRVEDIQDGPVILFTHVAARDVFPDSRAELGVQFDTILQHPNLTLTFSGHSHMNPDETECFGWDEHDTYHVHVPGLERTKVGSRHVPRLPVVELTADGEADIRLFNLDQSAFEPKHARTIELASTMADAEAE